MRVLLCDDDQPILDALAPHFQREHYQVSLATTGAQALAAAATEHLDLVVLDVGLPDIDGLEVCRRLRRRHRRLPILLLTARGSTDDQLAGLTALADDYVVKPVATDLLLARARTLLRRAGTFPGHRMLLGRNVVDLDVGDVWRDGQRLGLRRREFDLLQFLLEHPRQVFGPSQLIASVWGSEANVTTDTVRQTVRRIRERIEADPGAPQLLRTRAGLGYMLVPDGRW
jgi:DNA-binding response OmpR family regulator